MLERELEIRLRPTGELPAEPLTNAVETLISTLIGGGANPPGTPLASTIDEIDQHSAAQERTP
ncbi:MAG TPA: hypothetical protein VFY54_19640, partial [Rubrobacter sp.]|nr:hypothetical protein [Rubrobacter sp.]